MKSHRIFGLLCLVAWVPSCTSFVELPDRGPPLGEDVVRITVEAGDPMMLTDPYVDGSVFVGVLQVDSGGAVVRTPLDAIKLYEVRRFRSVRTIGLVVGLLAAAWIATVVIYQSTTSDT